MLDLFRLYRDPAEDGNDGGATVVDAPIDNDLSEDSITAALNAESSARESTPIDKPADKAVVKETPKSEAPADDPEFEIGFKEGKKKVKQSELVSAWEKSQDYTQKMQKIAETEKMHKDTFSFLNGIKANPKLTQLVLKVINGAVPSPEKGYDEAFIDRTLAQLDQKAEQIDTAQVKVETKIDDLEDKLKDLDPESPLAVSIRGTIKNQKALLAQLEAAGKNTTALQSRLEKIEGTMKNQTDAQAKAADAEKVSHAGNILTEQLTAMTDSEKNKDAFVFDTPNESKTFRKDVIQVMLANPREYKSPEEFANAIREAGKLVYGQLKEYRDALLAKYLKKPAVSSTSTVKKEDEEKTPVDDGTLESALSAALDQTNSQRRKGGGAKK